MTVVLTGVIQRYVGIASDTKPTDSDPGSEFYETDTGATYVYDGSAWQLRLGHTGLMKSTKSVTFDGAADTGAIGNVPLFTVTGEIVVAILVPFCTTLLAGATATLALGVTGSTSLFIAATTATNIDADEFWVDTAPDANGIAIPAALRDIAITDNIVGTVAVAAISAGVIRNDIYWRPLSSDGLVVAA